MQEDILKSASGFAVIIIFSMCSICSCSKNEKTTDNIFRGIYESSQQVQEMKYADELPQPDKEAPTYDQYKRERQEIITDHESENYNSNPEENTKPTY